MPSSQESVLALRAQGYTNAEIAQSLSGPSSSPLSASYISKIATGVKPAADREGQLAELASRGSVSITGAHRRQTTTGEQARVRISRRTQTSAGFVHRASGNRDIQRALEDAARQGKQVKITVRMRYIKRYGRPPESPAEIVLFQKGGYDAAKALNLFQSMGSPGGIREAMMDAVRSMDRVESAEGFLYAEINAFDKSGV